MLVMKKIIFIAITFSIFFGAQLLTVNKAEAGVTCKYDFFGNNVQCGAKGFVERDRKQINHQGEYNSLCMCMIYPIDRDLVFSCNT